MRFELTVTKPPQGIVSLVVEAGSADAAREEVQRDGYAVLSTSALRGAAWAWRRDRFDLPLFGQELLALMDAGLGLVEALALLADRARSSTSRAVLHRLLASISRGQSVSSAMEAIPEAFPVLFVASVRASERTGALGDGIRSYLAYRRSLDSLRSKVVSASIYPCILLVVGLLVVLFLLTYVVPRFSVVYAGLDQAQLPWMSRLLMEWGQTFSAHAGTLLAGLLAVLLAAAAVLRLPSVRAALQRRVWRLPRIGEQMRLYQLARFTRTLALLLRGGIPLPAALGMTAALLRQPALQAGLVAARQALEEGQGLAETFRRHGLANEVGVRLLSVGERGGGLDQTMERIAAFYDDENARQIDLFTRSFEPLLMVAMGLVIGGVVVLMYLPIFQLANSIQ